MGKKLIYYERHDLKRYFGAEGLDVCEVKIYKQGEPICEAGMPINHLQFFVEGRAKTYFLMENGKQLLLNFHEPLQLIGDLEILETVPVATNTVEAITTCTCLAIHKDYVHEVLSKDPNFLKELSLSLSRKLSRVIQNSALNQLNPLENRVASYILATAEKGVFSGNMSQISDQLGTSFRHLHRTLQKMCEKGLLEKEQSHYRIIHKEALQEKAAGIYIIK